MATVPEGKTERANDREAPNSEISVGLKTLMMMINKPEMMIKKMMIKEKTDER